MKTVSTIIKDIPKEVKRIEDVMELNLDAISLVASEENQSPEEYILIKLIDRIDLQDDFRAISEECVESCSIDAEREIDSLRTEYYASQHPSSGSTGIINEIFKYF